MSVFGKRKNETNSSMGVTCVAKGECEFRHTTICDKCKNNLGMEKRKVILNRGRVIKLIILEDTRNQVGKHDKKNEYFLRNGIEVRRTKLYCGDYTLPTDQSICIDTKKDIQELIGDICGKSHERFRNELIRAQESNIKPLNNTDNIYKVKEGERK